LLEREQQQRFLALLAQLTTKSPPIIDRPRSRSLSLTNSQLPSRNRSLSDVFERPDLLQSVQEKGPFASHREPILSTPQKLPRSSASTPQKSPSAAIQVQVTMQQLLSLKMQQEEQKAIEQELQYKLRAQLIKQKRKLKDKAKKERAKLLAETPNGATSSIVSESKAKIFTPSKTIASQSTAKVSTPSKLRVTAPLYATTAPDSTLDIGHTCLPPSRRLPTPETQKGLPNVENKERPVTRGYKNAPSSPHGLSTPPRHVKGQFSRDGRRNDIDASSGSSSSGSNSDHGDRTALRRSRTHLVFSSQNASDRSRVPSASELPMSQTV
jgi:hypothetical protein